MNASVPPVSQTSPTSSVDPQIPQPQSDLVYGLESKPPFWAALLAALQHILAMVLSVMAPPAIVAGALGVPAAGIAYLVSMSLLFAGIGIWCQVQRPLGIGSGMLSIQAVSFAFPGTLIAVGTMLMHDRGMGWEEALCTLFGVCFLGGFVVMLGSRAMRFLRMIITPTVAGITVMMIGVSLVKIGAVDMAGGFAAKGNGTFGDVSNLFLGTLVILTIVVTNRSKQPLVRMSSLIIGILVGFTVGALMGKVDWSVLTNDHTWFIMPVPFKFGFFGFDRAAFAILSFLFLVVVIEAIGDLTATSVVSEQPVSGKIYRSRLAGGILCDGLMTSLGAIFGCFPVATFSQNNGVIQLSGVASRKVGRFCGVLFIMFALFPIIVVLFQLLPRPVLGGALVVLFGTIACSGIRILLQHDVNRRESIVIAVSLGVGLMSMSTPDAFLKLPKFLQMFFDSAIVSGGVTAMVVHQLLPKATCALESDTYEDDCDNEAEFLFNKHDGEQ